MASCASADTATKMKLQAIESTQTTHAQVMEKELGKLAEDNRKKATDHKRDLDDLAVCVNAAVDRLYVWVHFVTDAIHLACSPDAPTDSTTYQNVDKCMRSGMQALALLLDNLVASVAVDSTGDGRSVLPLVRLVRESIVEAKALACIGVLFGRFGRVQVTANALATALDGTLAPRRADTTHAHGGWTSHGMMRSCGCTDTKGAVGRQAKEIQDLNLLHTVAKALTTKVDYVFNNTQAVARSSLEIERLANSVVSHDEFVVLAERLKRKPDANDIRAYVRQKISSLKLAQTDTNSDAPLLGSVPVRCMSCQNVVEAKVQPAASHEAKQREVLPFTTSSMRHVQKHKLDAMMKAKASPK
ncbi:hypothetical protein DYB32_003978 [Aphanomyces invadans]|uniref:Uncharacterized protein n=1 Tax=Aphanomyces invadans TaxID=157072 RepID=A0A3R6YAB6_9STRA|nr:hypothetical protein DYB32_003978 [Aphanomyces invadans]